MKFRFFATKEEKERIKKEKEQLEHYQILATDVLTDYMSKVLRGHDQEKASKEAADALITLNRLRINKLL